MKIITRISSSLYFHSTFTKFGDTESVYCNLAVCYSVTSLPFFPLKFEHGERYGAWSFLIAV